MAGETLLRQDGLDVFFEVDFELGGWGQPGLRTGMHAGEDNSRDINQGERMWFPRCEQVYISKAWSVTAAVALHEDQL